jgi:glutamate-1-semialdehyde 2,1-aminomutase
VELAEAVAARVASVEKVRLVSSGTEAAMTAVRLARGVTGRPKVLKFAGCYHGHLDSLLVKAGSGVATLGLPGSAGVTDGTVADTVVVAFNDREGVGTAFDRFGHDLAAVIVEPIAANMGLIAPAPGFLEFLRGCSTDAGALLVFDEVITGFRVGRGGAQGRYGVTPDLSMFGKVLGGGLPLAAIGGPAVFMDALAPLGPVYQAGTLSGNPLATAAGLAALDRLDAAAYARLRSTASALADGLRSACAAAGLVAQVPVASTLVGLYLGDPAPVDYEGAKATDEKAYAALFHGLLDRGVALAPGAYEVLFPGLAHTDDVVASIAAAAAEAAAETVK